MKNSTRLAVDSRPAFVPGHASWTPATSELLQLLTSRPRSIPELFEKVNGSKVMKMEIAAEDEFKP